MCRTKIYEHIPDTLATCHLPHTSRLFSYFIGKSVNSNASENTPGGCCATQFLWAIKFYKLQNALSRSSGSFCACLRARACVFVLYRLVQIASRICANFQIKPNVDFYVSHRRDNIFTPRKLPESRRRRREFII